MKEIVESNNSINTVEQKDISEIVSNEEMKNVFTTLFKECDEHRSEALDAYFIFKDSVMNGGEFETSGTSKEQMQLLLKVAQDCVDSKIKMFDSMLKVKSKKEVNINNNDISQTNVFVSNRRELLEAIESSKTEFGLNQIIEQDEQIKNEAQKLNEDINENTVNSEVIDIKIEAGEF